MVCPGCHHDTVSFARAYAKSGFGRHRCPECGAVSRVRKTAPWYVFEVALGLSVSGLALWFWFCFGDWRALVVAAALALVADIWMDRQLWVLELVEPPPGR